MRTRSLIVYMDFLYPPKVCKRAFSVNAYALGHRQQRVLPSTVLFHHFLLVKCPAKVYLLLPIHHGLCIGARCLTFTSLRMAPCSMQHVTCYRTKSGLPKDQLVSTALHVICATSLVLPWNLRCWCKGQRYPMHQVGLGVSQVNTLFLQFSPGKNRSY